MPPRIRLGVGAPGVRLVARAGCVRTLYRSAVAGAAPSSAKSALLPPAAAMPPAFAGLAAELSTSQPCFGAHGESVEMLEGPTVFHDRLLEMVRGAQRRILISTLYIGTEEESFVDAVATALAARPGVRAKFVLDYNRATRPGKGTPASTVDMLMPLLERFGDRVEVWLYRSPKLRGLLETIVPPRFNEGWGTWHAKYYAVDDDVMLSGANLAASYFTNRQDRYIHLASHPSLLSYLASITRLVSDYSYKVVPHARPGELGEHGVLLPPGSPPITVGKRGAFTASGPGALWRERSLSPRGWAGHANATFGAFQQAWRASNGVRMRDAAANGADTWFWPVLQAGVLNLGEEERAMAAVWAAIRKAHKAGEKVEVDLTSGYFGLYAAYKRAVVDSPAPVRVIAASPKANGFYGSKGVSSLIPEGYTLLERRFYADAAKNGRVGPGGVRLQEWEREGWTYHAKGMWVSEAEEGETPEQAVEHPFLTFIGSSNLSTRSLQLDTELSLLLATSNKSLRSALGHELATLREHAHDVGPATWATPERHVSLASRVLVALGVEGML